MTPPTAAPRRRPQAPAVRRILADIAASAPETVGGHEARRIVRRIRREAGCSREEFRELWESPEASFGPFGSLPEALQEGLRAAVVRETEERRFAVTDRLDRAVHGPVFRLGSELSLRGRQIRSRGGPWRRIGRGVYLFGRGLCWLSEKAGRAWLDAARFNRLGEVPPLHALWKWAGVDPMRPAIEYVRGVPCDPAASPVYRDSRRNVEAWMMVGLDLMPSGGDVHYIEANINPGFMMGRDEIHPEEDPLMAAVIDRARSRGQDRLVVFPSSIASIGRELEEIWLAQTEDAGIELEVRDDPRVRSKHRRGCDPVMDPSSRDTLYVNIRTLHHPLCVLLEEKGLFEDEIARHNRNSAAAERIPVPRRIRSPDDLRRPSPDGRFPNVVVKDPLLNEAMGIRMLRTESLDADVLRPPNVAFEFVPPELEELTQNGVSGEYGVKYRVNLLITPDGPRIVETVRATAGAPVPERIEEGQVEDLRPYVINSHIEGSEYSRASGEEHDRVAPTAMRIGRLVHDFLCRLHGPSWPEVTGG